MYYFDCEIYENNVCLNVGEDFNGMIIHANMRRLKRTEFNKLINVEKIQINEKGNIESSLIGLSYNEKDMENFYERIKKIYMNDFGKLNKKENIAERLINLKMFLRRVNAQTLNDEEKYFVDAVEYNTRALIYNYLKLYQSSTLGDKNKIDEHFKKDSLDVLIDLYSEKCVQIEDLLKKKNSLKQTIRIK